MLAADIEEASGDVDPNRLGVDAGVAPENENAILEDFPNNEPDPAEPPKVDLEALKIDPEEEVPGVTDDEGVFNPPNIELEPNGAEEAC